MNLQICYYVREIVLEKSLTKAAQNLFITQSALSQQIDKLEQEFHAKLFVYQGGRMLPTEAGERLYRGCEQMIAVKERAYRQMRMLEKGKADYLSIAVDRQVASIIIAEVIPGFKELYPNCKINIVEQDAFAARQMLKERKIDLAIMLEIDNPYDCIKEEILCENEIYLVMSRLHPLAKQFPGESQVVEQPVDLKLFRDEDFILGKPSACLRAKVNQRFRSTGIIPNVFLEINNFYAVQKMVEKNIGVAFVPGSCCAFYPNLLYLHLQPRFYYNIMLAYNAEQTVTKPMQDLMDLIRIRCKEGRFGQ